MNILDKLAAILNMPNVYLGTMPAKPDACIGVFEYPGAPPVHWFGGMDIRHSVQARTRDTTAEAAYAQAEAVAAILGRYSDGEISCIQSTPILDIGVDRANPPRHEYTVNFEIRRLR